MAIVLPFLTAFLIRIYAWINILQREGLLERRAARARPHSRAAGRGFRPIPPIIIGIVYSYLPFMVLPLYASLEKMDETLLEAAADLGCPWWKAFWLVTVPLSAPGIVAGALLCFIPIVGEFVIPDLLGGSDSLMIGQTLWSEFFSNKDWPVASALAVALLLILLVPIVIYQHLQMRTLGGPVMRRGLSFFNVTAVVLGLAFLYLPIVILVIYSFNASRLVTVWGGWSTRWYVALLNDPRHARSRLEQPAHRGSVGHGRDRARHARCGRAGAERALPRPHRVLRPGLRAAGDARGHHRARRCCCCSSRSTPIAASGP